MNLESEYRMMAREVIRKAIKKIKGDNGIIEATQEEGNFFGSKYKTTFSVTGEENHNIHIITNDDITVAQKVIDEIGYLIENEKFKKTIDVNNKVNDMRE